MVQLDKGPFFFGEKPMYCDFAVYHVLSNAKLLSPECCDAHSNIVSFMTHVEALPGVSDYIAHRPDPVDIGTAPMLKAK